MLTYNDVCVLCLTDDRHIVLRGTIYDIAMSSMMNGRVREKLDIIPEGLQWSRKYQLRMGDGCGLGVWIVIECEKFGGRIRYSDWDDNV